MVTLKIETVDWVSAIVKPYKNKTQSRIFSNRRCVRVQFNTVNSHTYTDGANVYIKVTASQRYLCGLIPWPRQSYAVSLHLRKKAVPAMRS